MGGLQSNREVEPQKSLEVFKARRTQNEERGPLYPAHDVQAHELALDREDQDEYS